MPSPNGLDALSIDRGSAECTSPRHKTGNYNGIVVFIKFIEIDSLTLTRDDLLELKLASPHCLRCYSFVYYFV